MSVANARGLSSIRNLLRLLVVMFVLVVIAIISFAWSGFAYKQAQYSENYHNRMVPLYEVERIGALLEESRAHLLLAIQHDPTSPFANDHDHPTSMHTDRVRSNVREVERLWASFRTKPRGPLAARLADELEVRFREYIKDGINPTLDLLTAGEYYNANAQILLYVNPLFTASAQAQAAMSSRLLEGAEEAYELMQQRAQSLTLSLVLAGALGILLSLFFAIYVIRSINQGINALSSLAARMSEGDLRVAGNPKDASGELGIILQQFRNARNQLRTTVGSLLQSSHELGALSEKGSVIAEQARNSVQQQKQETDMVATAMNEMNATVHEVAQHAENAAESANHADDEAQRGSHVVAESVSSMNQLAAEVEDAARVIQELVQDANKIGSVVDVIRDIAEQTNLLALNAAIEAARAGEQGRGFAVVADEVRTLASRTQDSTTQINTMIAHLQQAAGNASRVMARSLDRAHEGVDKADEASKALSNITQLISNMNEMNIQIASAAEEQSAVAEEMNLNLTRINEAADQTADASEQTADSSRSIARLAHELQKTAAHFKI
ncbi:methyl-accepting chemotaxis protein [Marinospirillum alkaliphilum]|uniref:Methyl-accepting chemotaxis sensory transducer with TarH sensor n=1 Tax=Marinospirillum alkaliphilum DSM 21637 TaxID=1122209 RepID=A0A1K1UG49_9GAMM|nr:methyl-accepting chemotaxis protein [Marinospirillum alkaliphilum]SFX11325.1 methyl-accepting chemotaxis sensory transducer with TarH sensor [Marinospirillum alkaliphilum DSM 21637]